MYEIQIRLEQGWNARSVEARAFINGFGHFYGRGASILEAITVLSRTLKTYAGDHPDGEDPAHAHRMDGGFSQCLEQVELMEHGRGY